MYIFYLFDIVLKSTLLSCYLIPQLPRSDFAICYTIVIVSFCIFMTNNVYRIIFRIINSEIKTLHIKCVKCITIISWLFYFINLFTHFICSVSCSIIMYLIAKDYKNIYNYIIVLCYYVPLIIKKCVKYYTKNEK